MFEGQPKNVVKSGGTVGPKLSEAELNLVGGKAMAGTLLMRATRSVQTA